MSDPASGALVCELLSVGIPSAETTTPSPPTPDLALYAKEAGHSSLQKRVAADRLWHHYCRTWGCGWHTAASEWPAADAL
jgi:hypothetical protein